jgi:hypothetical protein
MNVKHEPWITGCFANSISYIEINDDGTWKAIGKFKPKMFRRHSKCE